MADSQSSDDSIESINTDDSEMESSASACIDGSLHPPPLTSGSFLEQHFDKCSTSSNGGCGFVVKYKSKTDGKEYAVKTIPIALYNKNDRLWIVEKKLGCPIEGRPQISSNSDDPTDDPTDEENTLIAKCQKVRKEAQLLAKLSHKHVIRYNLSWFRVASEADLQYDGEIERFLEEDPDSNSNRVSSSKESGEASTEDPNKKYLVLHIVMEQCDNSFKTWMLNQRTLAIPFDPKTYARLLLELLEGVNYIHLQGITHRDLKPDNILLQNDKDGLHVKIIDFGLAKETEVCLSESGTHSPASPVNSRSVGTRGYRSPEQISGIPYGAESDMYSVGVIIAEAWAQRTDHELSVHIEGVRRGKPEFLEQYNMEEVSYLVKNLICEDRCQRLDARMCLDKMQEIHKMVSKAPGDIGSDLPPSQRPEVGTVQGDGNECAGAVQATNLSNQVAQISLDDHGRRSMDRSVAELSENSETMQVIKQENENLKREIERLKQEMDGLKQENINVKHERDNLKLQKKRETSMPLRKKGETSEPLQNPSLNYELREHPVRKPANSSVTQTDQPEAEAAALDQAR